VHNIIKVYGYTIFLYKYTDWRKCGVLNYFRLLLSGLLLLWLDEYSTSLIFNPSVLNSQEKKNNGVSITATVDLSDGKVPKNETAFTACRAMESP